MLDPAFARVDLRELGLGGGDHPRAAIEHKRPAGGGALVEGEDKRSGHGDFSAEPSSRDEPGPAKLTGVRHVGPERDGCTLSGEHRGLL